MSNDKRLRERDKQLKPGKTAMQKWLELARHVGILLADLSRKPSQT